MNAKSKLASLSVAVLLVLAPFLQVSPVVATSLSEKALLQMSQAPSSQEIADSQCSSSTSNDNGSDSSSNDNGELVQQFRVAWFNLGNLSSMFDKSVVAGFMTSQIQVLNTSVVSSKLDSGTERSLVAKLNVAYNKASDASCFILQAQLRQTDNMLNATDKTLNAFINQVRALGGKIPPARAASFVESAQAIVQGSILRGPSVAQLVPSADLSLSEELQTEIDVAVQDLRKAIGQLQQAGIQVQVDVVDVNSIAVVVIVLGVVYAFPSYVLANYVTERISAIMSSQGRPLSIASRVLLFFANMALFEALLIVGTVVAFNRVVHIVGAEIAGLFAVGTASATLLAEMFQDHIVADFIANLLIPAEVAVLNLFIQTVTTGITVRSLSITDGTFGRGVVNYFGRSTFFDNGRFWIFFWNGASVNFVTSPDGQSWSTPTLVSAASTMEDAPEWSIWFDGTNVHYAIACCSTSPSQGNDIFYRRGVPQADGTIAWSAPEQKLSLNAKYPMLTVDDQGFPWIIYQNTGASFRIDGVKSSTNDGTFVIQTGFPVVINPVCCGLGVSILSPMSGGKMLIESNAACCFGVALQVQAWTGTSFLPAVTVGTTNGYAQGVSEGDRVHLVFLDASNNIMDKVYDFASNSIVSSTLVITGGSGVPVLTRDPSNGNIFVFYTTTNQVLFLKRDGSTGQWSTDPTQLVSEPSGFWTVGVTVSYEPYGGRFSLAYVRNTSAPQELMFFHFFG